MLELPGIRSQRVFRREGGQGWWSQYTEPSDQLSEDLRRFRSGEAAEEGEQSLPFPQQSVPGGSKGMCSNAKTRMRPCSGSFSQLGRGLIYSWSRSWDNLVLWLELVMQDHDELTSTCALDSSWSNWKAHITFTMPSETDNNESAERTTHCA